MADSPPPYCSVDQDPDSVRNLSDSWYHIPSKILRNEPEHTASPGLPSIKSYIHRIDVHVTVAKAPERLIITAHFMVQDAGAISTALSFATILDRADFEDFKVVQGFQDLDISNLMVSTGNEADDDIRHSIHDLLIERLGSPDLERHSTCNMDESKNDNLSQIHVFKIPMYSKYPGSLSDSADSNTSLLYKWAKPQSIYGRLSGAWETSLVNVLRDGVVNAGGQLQVFVRGVQQGQLRDLEAKWQDGTHVLEF